MHEIELLIYDQILSNTKEYHKSESQHALLHARFKRILCCFDRKNATGAWLLGVDLPFGFTNCKKRIEYKMLS